MSLRLANPLTLTTTSPITAIGLLPLLALLLMLLSPHALADELKARVDRQQLHRGETLQLQLSYSGDDNVSPDLSPLQRDFDILGRSQSSQRSWINGKTSSSLTWVIVLAPNASGEITVPALQAGNARSEPLTIKVEEAVTPGASDHSLPPATADDADDPQLYLVADANPSTSYELGEVNYRLRIYSAQPLSGGALSELNVAGAQVTRQGDEKRYQEQVNGREYQVIELNYSLIPQHSGSLEIPAQTLQARVRTPASQRRLDPFGNIDPFAAMMDPGQVVTVRSNPLLIDVKPRPAAAQGWFLPATKVTISQRWQPQPPQLKVGEAVTRIIHVEAVGASPAQLPQLRLSDIPSVRQYLEHSDSRSEQTADGRAAVLDQTITLIPLQAGPLTLPAITVNWWDTTSNSQRSATLPALTLEVSAAPGQPAAATAAPAAAANSSDQQQVSATTTSQPPAPVISKGHPLLWFSALLLAVASVIAAAIYWRRYRQPRPSPTTAASSQSAASKALAKACRDNDPRAAYLALRRYQQVGGQLPTTLETTAAIDLLTSAAYAANPPPWHGQDLWRLIQKGDTAPSPRKRSLGLPPLYPDGASS